MADKPFFSARISQSLSDAIEVHRKQTGESKTEVLTRALAKYINYELDDRKNSLPPIQEKLDEIFQRLDALENKEITTDNNIDNSEITDDNFQILPSKEVIELLDITQPTLSNWRNQNKLPKQKNGYEISFMPEISTPRRQKWKVITLDN